MNLQYLMTQNQHSWYFLQKSLRDLIQVSQQGYDMRNKILLYRSEIREKNSQQPLPWQAGPGGEMPGTTGVCWPWVTQVNKMIKFGIFQMIIFRAPVITSWGRQWWKKHSQWDFNTSIYLYIYIFILYLKTALSYYRVFKINKLFGQFFDCFCDCSKLF